MDTNYNLIKKGTIITFLKNDQKLVHLFDTHQGRPGSSLGAMEHQLVERMLDEAEGEFKIGIILVNMRIV